MFREEPKVREELVFFLFFFIIKFIAKLGLLKFKTMKSNLATKLRVRILFNFKKLQNALNFFIY